MRWGYFQWYGWASNIFQPKMMQLGLGNSLGLGILGIFIPKTNPPWIDLNGESQGLIISFPILLAISRWIRHSPMSNGLLCFTPIIYHIFASNSQNLPASGFSTSSEVFMAKPKKTPSPKARRGERGMQPLWNEGSSIILLGLGLSFRSLIWEIYDEIWGCV